MLTDVRIVGFEWDRGNRSKCQKHGVSLAEIEAVLLPTAGSFVFPDARHSSGEPRFIAIGRTEAGRGVFAVFTLRRHGEETFIRPVSARYMHRKEVEYYEKEISHSQNR